MGNKELSSLTSYLNSQLNSAWRVAADSSSCNKAFCQELCSTINMSLKTNPQTRVELELFAQEAMRQLHSNSMLLRESGIPTENNSSTVDNILNITGKAGTAAGFYTGYKQYDLYIEAKWNGGVGKWKGKNGVWYMEKVDGKKPFWGNQFTGSRKDIIAESMKYSKIGYVLFGVGTTISIIQGAISFTKGNIGGAVKSVVDIAVGAIATWGGPVGWAIGGIYLILDLAGAFEPRYSQCVSPYAKNPHVNLRDNTYVKQPIVPYYLRQRIPIVHKTNAEFRQGYKRY